MIANNDYNSNCFDKSDLVLPFLEQKIPDFIKKELSVVGKWGEHKIPDFIKKELQYK